jgi:hypothetical protein
MHDNGDVGRNVSHNPHCIVAADRPFDQVWLDDGVVGLFGVC